MMLTTDHSIPVHGGTRLRCYLLAVAALLVAPGAQALDVAKLQLKWHHQFQFAGYYAALEKGFYRDVGLEVDILEGGPKVNAIGEVVTGRADFGVGTSGALVARARGQNVVVLAAVFQHSPTILLVLGAMRRELLSGGYIQADETPVDVQSERTKGKNHQAYLWQYSRPGGQVVFDFQLDRGRQGPRQFLGEFAGILQTDGYTGYGKVGGKDMVHAGCWAHARRYFFQAVQLNRRDLLALGIVAEIDKLFELEAEAKAAGLGAAERLGLRREKAEPIVEGLKEGIESARASTLPRSALGKACDYALGRWGQLRRFLDYGQLELSNNLAANAIRPVAVGRNYEQSGIRQSSMPAMHDFRRWALDMADRATPLVFA